MFEAFDIGSKLWMEPSNVRLVVRGCTAILTCDEDVFCRRFFQGEDRITEKVNKLTATNIFRKIKGRWLMSYHHASWHADSVAARKALATTETSGYKSELKENSLSKVGKPNSSLDALMGSSDYNPII